MPGRNIEKPWRDREPFVIQSIPEQPLLVTGGAGFIGSALVRRLIATTEQPIVILDRMGYAASREAIHEALASPQHTLEVADLRDAESVDAIFRRHQPAGVIHLAAETHVDRSIDGPGAFIESNITGTFHLLEAARRHWQALDAETRDTFRFHHVSTDEVFGSLGDAGAFTEESPYDPRSPYSASKAAADHLVRAWHHTYGLPTVVSNCSNNYGPWQYPEKLIPLMILNALDGRPLPVYGDGGNVRDWLHVDDHARALHAIYGEGRAGGTYNVGGGAERTNLEVVEALCVSLDERRPRPDGRSYQEQIEFVADRPGHDFRYAMDYSHLAGELGWQPRHSFASGIDDTVDWYLQHTAWCDRVRHAAHERRGLASAPTGASA